MTFASLTMRDLLADESGATAIEYGLIASLIAVAAMQAMSALGNELQTTFSAVSTDLSSADEPPPPASVEAPT